MDSQPLARGDGQPNTTRGLVGNVVVIVGVVVTLAPIVIKAAGITIVFMVVVAIAEDVLEAIRRRPPPNLNRCLDAAAGGKYM